MTKGMGVVEFFVVYAFWAITVCLCLFLVIRVYCGTKEKANDDSPNVPGGGDISDWDIPEKRNKGIML